MKGRTTCPKCKHEFVMDFPENNKKHNVACPKCKNKFAIQAKCDEPNSSEECSWEEHGEPRKTILSAIKPKTNKPMIAIILLVCVFVIGMTTAVFSEVFIESTMDVASGFGLTSNVDVYVINESNVSLEDVSVKIDGSTGLTNAKGIFSAENVELGILTVEVSASGFKTQKYEILVTPFFNSDSTIMIEEGSGVGEKVDFDSVGCLLILTIFSIFALVGILACIKRQHIDVAIVSAFLSIFSFGFFFIGSILGIIACVLIIKSKEEFENGKKGKIF